MEWQRAHPERRQANNQSYVDRNRELINERKRAQHDPAKRRVKNLRVLYKLTPEMFADMLASQGGKCAVCRGDDPGGRHGVWHVDHDHVAGTVRGLLCDGCNRGLGFFRDDPVALKAAIEYLARTGRI